MTLLQYLPRVIYHHLEIGNSRAITMAFYHEEVRKTLSYKIQLVRIKKIDIYNLNVHVQNMEFLLITLRLMKLYENS